MEKLIKYLKWLFALAAAAVTLWSFTVPDAAAFQQPEYARVFFWHFPCPILGTVFGLLTGWFSYKFLATHDIAWDVRAEAAVELTTIFWLVTMASGILFSELEWGLWWQWDPRQTSFLLVLLIYFAYFALRGSFSDDVRKATHSAAYYLAALGPTLFLIYVFPRLPQIAQSSFHPTQSIMQGQIKGEYAYIILATLTLASIVAAWLYRLRVKAGLLLLEEPSYGNLETDRSDTAHPPVVRPIRVPDESRE